MRGQGARRRRIPTRCLRCTRAARRGARAREGESPCAWMDGRGKNGRERVSREHASLIEGVHQGSGTKPHSPDDGCVLLITHHMCPSTGPRGETKEPPRAGRGAGERRRRRVARPASSPSPPRPLPSPPLTVNPKHGELTFLSLFFPTAQGGPTLHRPTWAPRWDSLAPSSARCLDRRGAVYRSAAAACEAAMTATSASASRCVADRPSSAVPPSTQSFPWGKPRLRGSGRLREEKGGGEAWKNLREVGGCVGW